MRRQLLTCRYKVLRIPACPAKAFDECKALQAKHHAQMEARAKEQGKVLPAPRGNSCDRMKARGLLK